MTEVVGTGARRGLQQEMFQRQEVTWQVLRFTVIFTYAAVLDITFENLYVQSFKYTVNSGNMQRAIST